MWWLFIGVIVIGILVLTAWLLNGVLRVNAAERIVNAETEQLLSLSDVEAQTLAYQLILRFAKTQEWADAPALNSRSELTQINSALRGLLTSYRRITFPVTGTIISADFFLTSLNNNQTKVIAEIPEVGSLLTVQGENPEVYEVSNGQIKESYPSIFHYIIVVESQE